MFKILSKNTNPKSDINTQLKISVLNTVVLNNIYTNLLLCNLSYKNPDELNDAINTNILYNDIKPLLNKQLFLNNKKTDLQGYIWINNDTMNIAFRGTSSIKDALVDLNFLQTKLKKNIYVHSGFYLQYKSIEKDIFDYINNNNIKKISITGHSLGGGVAAIASSIIADIYKDIDVSCYTFGSPRVGNMKFKQYFKNNVKYYYRIHIKDDPISMVSSLPSYNHVCKGICISDDNNIDYLPDIKWYKRLIYCLTSVNYLDLFESHHTIVYIEKIKKIIDSNIIKTVQNPPILCNNRLNFPNYII